jgi:hypothetical protein
MAYYSKLKVPCSTARQDWHKYDNISLGAVRRDWHKNFSWYSKILLPRVRACAARGNRFVRLSVCGHKNRHISISRHLSDS